MLKAACWEHVKAAGETAEKMEENIQYYSEQGFQLVTVVRNPNPTAPDVTWVAYMKRPVDD